MIDPGDRIDGIRPQAFVVGAMDAGFQTLDRAIEEAGCDPRHYLSAAEFMARCPRAEIGVIFVEFSSLGAETLLERLCRQPAPHPVVVLTDTSDFDCVVRAFRLGAMDVLPRDVADEGLGDCLRQALAQDRARLTARREWSEVQGLIQSLTPRERQVMDRVVAGYANREIAVELDISEKTVEVHRHKVMLKMEADSLAELVRKNVVLEAAAAVAPRLNS